MERLTERDSNGITFLVCQEGCNGGPACIECEQRAINRLADYEDTGLEPEEIETLLAERAATGWISVEDRLPEANEIVRAKSDTAVATARRTECGLWLIKIGGQWRNWLSAITHWMPLPTQNAPLTLDELREMDGEPVWVVTGSAINAGRGCWDICDWWDKNTVMFPYSGEQPIVDDYGITWTAYRRKPEEGTT